MSDFLSAYTEHTKDYESPSSFWRWSGYATISAVLRDSCYRRQGDSYLFPNIYVLLLAESSGHRKNRPIDLCEMLVHSTNNTKLISGSTSIQALVDELSHSETSAKDGKIKKAGAGILVAQEFSAALVEDPRAIKILTDIYDYKPMGYAIRLISRAHSKVDKLVFSFFGGSNESMLKGFFDNTAIYGGLLARTFLIIPNEFRPSNSLWETPESLEARQKSYKNLAGLLKKIAELNGEFQFDEAAKQEYDEWYKPFRMTYKTKPDKSGVTGRIHTSVLKIAMIMAANELSLCVRKRHIEQAIEVCLSLLPNYNMFVMTTGNSTIKEAGAILLQELTDAPSHTVTRKYIIQQHWAKFDAETLDKLVVTFESGGLITSVTQSNGEVSYVMTQKCMEIMQGEK